MRYAAVAALVAIGVAVIVSACGGTKYANDAQAWTAKPDVSGGTLNFDDGSAIHVRVVDAAGHCYALDSMDDASFTTHTSASGELDPATVDLTVTIDGQVDCSLVR